MLNDWAVLVVEDNPADAYLVERAFEAAASDAHVFRARDGAEAIMIANEAAPDMVLLDLELPDMDGLDLLAQFKTQSRQLPIVVLTSSIEERRRSAAISSGAEFFVTKPGSFIELVTVVEELMRRFRPKAPRVLVPSDLDQRRCELLTSSARELETTISALTTSLALIELRGAAAFSDGSLKRRMKRQLDRSAAATRLIGDVARAERADFALALEEGDLAQLVVELVRRSRAAKHAIIFEPPAERCPMLLDAEYLEEALANVLENAIEFSHDAAPITVELSKQSEECVVRVRDLGIGIPQDELTQVGERYFRASNVRSRHRGAGVGLWIAREIVSLHGGSLTVTSELDRGTEVVVRLPRFGPVHRSVGG
jgi:signal transduction histidine kinase